MITLVITVIFLKEYAHKNSIEVVGEYTDAETAKKSGRTNYNEMLKFLKFHKDIKTVLVEKTDRLYRNFKDFVQLEDYHCTNGKGICNKKTYVKEETIEKQLFEAVQKIHTDKEQKAWIIEALKQVNNQKEELKKRND